MKTNVTNTQTWKRMASILSGTLFLASAAFAQQPPQRPQSQPQQQQQQQPQEQIQQRLAQIQNQLQSVNQEIETVRSEAANEPVVQEAMFDYDQALTETMKEMEPDQVELIERRSELFREIITADDFNSMEQEEMEEFRKKNQEFVQIREQLQQVEMQGRQEAEVMDAWNQYAEKVLAEMREINPSITEKMKKRDELTSEFSNLQRQISN